MEFYARRNHHGYETPLILPDPDLISKAEAHHAECDYKAAAVYARSAFEQIIRDYCDKRPKKTIPFHKKAKDYKSQHFWSAIRDDPKVAPLVADVERYRELVLNPFSHYDTEKHEIGTELRDAINTIKAHTESHDSATRETDLPDAADWRPAMNRASKAAFFDEVLLQALDLAIKRKRPGGHLIPG